MMLFANNCLQVKVIPRSRSLQGQIISVWLSIRKWEMGLWLEGIIVCYILIFVWKISVLFPQIAIEFFQNEIMAVCQPGNNTPKFVNSEIWITSNIKILISYIHLQFFSFHCRIHTVRTQRLLDEDFWWDRKRVDAVVSILYHVFHRHRPRASVVSCWFQGCVGGPRFPRPPMPATAEDNSAL